MKGTDRILPPGRTIPRPGRIEIIIGEPLKLRPEAFDGPQAKVRRADYTKMSLMPEGLLEAMPPTDVTDLFAYLQTLK